MEYRTSGVLIGDVGIIYRSGKFNFLFNIFLSANHPINRGRVPEKFYPLDFSKVANDLDEDDAFGPDSYLTSSSLRKTGNLDSSGFVFETYDREGAILMMPKGATSQDLLNRHAIERYVKDNAELWYNYVINERGRAIDNGDIRIVVGCDKVSSWGIATFASSAAQQVRLEFKGRPLSHESTRSYTWDCVGTASVGRVGPQEAEIRELGQGTDASSASHLQNQCVFVRTMNFTLGGRLSNESAAHKVRSGNLEDGLADTDTLTDHADGASSSSGQYGFATGRSYSGQVHINSNSTHLGLPVVHPSKYLHKVLMEKYPYAKIVITRDTDWTSVLSKADLLVPDEKEICARVLASHVISEENGIVTIQKKVERPEPPKKAADAQKTFVGRLNTMAFPRFWAYFSANIVRNAMLRYTLLRIIYALTASLLIAEFVSNGNDIKTLIVVVVIFAHYLLSAIGLNYLPAFMDVSLASAEVALILPHHVTSRLLPRFYLLGASLKWIIPFLLILYALLRVADILSSLYNGSSLWTRCDITGFGARAGADESRLARLMDTLAGRPRWKRQFTGEAIQITIFRDIFACCITAITMLALCNVVVRPVYMMDVIPVKTFRSPTAAMPTDFFGNVPTVWNILVARPKYLTGEQDNNPDFSSAVNVTPFWDDWNGDNNTSCGFAPNKTFQIQEPKFNETWDIITFYCASRVSIPQEKKLSFTIPAPHHDTRPNLLVTVNFTALNISSQSLQNIRGNSVQIMLGLTNNTLDVISRTMPTTLLPGVNLVGAANLFNFQRFRNSRVSVFRPFDYYESFQASEISHIWPDPLASTSTFITRSPNVSTMRIFLQNDFAYWRITQDIQEKSVLKGFSVVGGLWVFFGGIFAWLFGKSIVRLVKPDFSISDRDRMISACSKAIILFGPMTAFQKDRIREVYRYPHISIDMTSTTKDNHDPLRFMADEIADLKILADTSTTTKQATEDDTLPLTQMEGEPQSPGPSQPTSSRNSGQSGENKFVPSAHEIC